MVIPKKSQTKAETFGELIHSDFCGPMETKSLQGSHYMAVYLDDATHWIYVTGIRKKSDQLQTFKNFNAMLETQFGVQVRFLRTDNGREFVSAEASDFLKF
jgi:hypothetical protein